MAMQRIQVGAGVKCLINGIDWGIVTGVEFANATPHREAYSLDSMWPQELIPTTARIGGSITLLRTVNDGGLEKRGIVPASQYLPYGMYISITLVEIRTDTILFKSSYSVVDDQKWTVPAKGMIAGSFSFKGLSWINSFMIGN